MNLENLNDELFTIHHLTQDDILSRFVVAQGKGLEHYLKNTAKNEEKEGVTRTYLIKRRDNNQIAAYFSLRTGLITVSRGLFNGFDTYTGIELDNFAVNDDERIDKNMIPHMGSYLFNQFVSPLVSTIHDYVGAGFLYIFALPKDRLIEHYKQIGFSVVSEKMERYVYRHVKPYYDKGCKFMFMAIE